MTAAAYDGSVECVVSVEITVYLKFTGSQFVIPLSMMTQHLRDNARVVIDSLTWDNSEKVFIEANKSTSYHITRSEISAIKIEEKSLWLSPEKYAEYVK